MMRVMQINTFCGSGSTGRIATDIYDVLQKQGHECCIAYGRGNAPNNYTSIKVGNKIDLYAHILKTRLLDLHGFGSKRPTQKLIEQIESFNPDIIQLHNLHGYYINIKILFDYLSKKDIPIVWLLHDAWSVSGHSAHFELDEYNQIPTKNLNKYQHKEYPKSYLIDNSKRNYMFKKENFTKLKNLTIITPSDWLAEVIRKSFLSKYDIKVVNNGIDLDKFSISKSPTNFREKYNLKNKKMILGVASVWTEKKGLYYFDKLARTLSKEYSIVLIGANKNISKKINHNIICIPKTENIKELVEAYSAADIFVNPTLEDTFPTTNIESMACGTPVITFRTGGSPESLSDNSGVVVEKEDFQQLVRAIKNFDFKKHNANACIKQSEKYDKKLIYELYIELYKNLLTER